MSAPFNKSWAFDKHYFHHSNPNRPLCVVLYEKCVIRPLVDWAWKVKKGESSGDKNTAQAIIKKYESHAAKMLGGTLAEDCAKSVLIEDHTYEAALRHGMSLLDAYQPRDWDDGKDERQLIVVRDEFADVLKNTIAGVTEAHEVYGLNRITGQSEILANLAGLELPYSGFPDFSRRIELKTKWSTAAATKSGKRSASLPSTPDWNHVQQVAGYWAGTGLMQAIVYANAKEYRVFNEDNCDLLTQEGLQSVLNHMVAKLAIRENLLKSCDSIEQMLRLIEPDFKHFFAWDKRPEVVNDAKKLWGFK